MGFTLTNPIFLAGKSAVACAIALLLVQALSIPDLVTASFVAVLCCSPGALMGLRTSADQLAGSVLGGVFGTLGAVLELPAAIGVGLAVGLAVLCTHRIGFHRGTVAAAFTALFLQLVSFGEPLQTFSYRLEAVGIAGLSAFAVNVGASSLFYGPLFRRRLAHLAEHLDEVLSRAGKEGPTVLVGVFPIITEMAAQLSQAVKEVHWRGNKKAEAELSRISAHVSRLQDVAHLAVHLEYCLPKDSPELREFLTWMPERRGPAPTLPESAQATREKILHLLDSARDRPRDSGPD